MEIVVLGKIIRFKEKMKKRIKVYMLILMEINSEFKMNILIEIIGSFIEVHLQPFLSISHQ